MRGNMNKKRVTEIFYLNAKNECTGFSNAVAGRIEYFMAKYINGKTNRWPGEMRLYFSDDLWSYAWGCLVTPVGTENPAEAYCNQHDVFIFRDHVFCNSVHRDSALGTNKMRIEYTWEEKEMGPNESYLEQIKNVKLYWAPTEAWIKPKKVIWNNPATIVYWSDGSKTVVKRQKGDRWDPEKGYAMAIVKKFMGLKKFYEALDGYDEFLKKE